MNRVECVSSSVYAERPVAFYWEGERLEVVMIENRWRSPSGVGFRVRVANGSIYELFYGEEEDEWTIHQP